MRVFLVLLTGLLLVSCSQQPRLQESGIANKLPSSSVSSSVMEDTAKWTTTLRSEGLLIARDGREDVIRRIISNDSFSYLIGDFAVYVGSVYFGNSIVKNISPDTFTLLANGYMKDSDTVIFAGALKTQHPILHESVSGADAATFVVIQKKPYTAEDSRHRYFYTSQYIEGVDNADYYLEGSHIPGSDPLSFVSIGWGYTKDKNRVYCNREVLLGADPATFTSFETPSFWKDRNNIYAGCGVLAGLDPQTTVYFVPDIYLKDKNGIYDVEKKAHVREQDISCDTIHPNDRTKFRHCER